MVSENVCAFLVYAYLYIEVVRFIMCDTARYILVNKAYIFMNSETL
jgi:hypothetical protein